MRILVDDELESLREKRKRELLAQSLKKDLELKKQEEKIKKERERLAEAAMIVNQVLEPEARHYMDWLSKNKPAVAHTIRETVILILHKNLLKKPLSKIEIMKIEREITGQESSIQVKRRGQKATDLNQQIKKKRESED